MGKNKNKKRPAADLQPTDRQVRVWEPDHDWIQKQNPAWRFSFVDLDGPWGWNEIQPADIERILGAFRSFESMTWSEIEQAKSCGFIEVASLSKKAQKRLDEIDKSELDPLFKLRLTGKQRVWGHRDRHIMRILWWDPEHTVYPMDLADNRN